jgi:alkyl hydroperoxide reductase subunit AhpC
MLYKFFFRGTFIIDGKGILRHYSVNDLPVGRNVDETLRLVAAFIHTDEFGEVCPAKWEKGQKTMVADPSEGKNDDYWKNVHAKK